jgi:hypothetical protein
MISNIPKILIFFCLLFNSHFAGTGNLARKFSTVPNKGIWGGENGMIQSDFSGITTWTLELID